VFEPSVVLQINRDAGRTPGKTPDQCERTRLLGPLPDSRYHLIRSRSLNTPVRSSTEARRLVWNDWRWQSVIIAGLLAQIGQRFGFRLIVEEGLSHAVLTQTQGCEPVIINPKMFLKLKFPTALR
jgi:hypothetical protein